MSDQSLNYNSNIQNALNVLLSETKELYLPSKINEIQENISPLHFYKEYVSRNLPVVIRDGIKHWKALKKWNIPYFKKIIGDKLVNVAVTPNGYADAISFERLLNNEISEKKYFFLPEERLIPMNDFLKELESPCEDSIFYVQKQNSNFEEFHELWKDVESYLPWATEAFGVNPDAINFWMGDKRAITSMHKDHYENIYCVISGEKEFILHPPTDLPWIPYKNYPVAVYKEIEPKKWTTIQNYIETNINATKEPRTISWIDIDPLNPDYEKYPLYKNATKLTVKVKAGDILYLPSLWFHHVRQSHACIAINYWYDMQYDIKYAYFKTLEALCL